MDRTRKQRLARQGFVGLSDKALSQVGPWLRIAPALCAAIVLAGTMLEQWVVFWMLAPAGILAATTRKHPFDVIYDMGIRSLLGRQRILPLYRAPRRFAAALEAAASLVAGAAFFFGYVNAGVLIGSLFAGAMLLSATTDISLGSLLYHAVMPRHGHRSPAVRDAVAVMLQRQSISAPQSALYQRPQLRRTGSRG